MSEQIDSGDRKHEQLEHARRINACIARSVSRQRAIYFGLMNASVLVGVVLFLIGQNVFGLCSIGLTVVFGLLLLDAHGQLQEIRQRPVGTLAPHISEFLRPRPTGEQLSETTKRPT